MTTEQWTPSSTTQKLFNEAIVIDGLDTSDWGDERIFSDLRDGGLTAINASTAVWENFHETLELTTAWLRWFD